MTFPLWLQMLFPLLVEIFLPTISLALVIRFLFSRPLAILQLSNIPTILLALVRFLLSHFLAIPPIMGGLYTAFAYQA